MKCGEEVMDWMQRYVDHELGEEETSQLMNHVATCPDCAEKFHILQALSRELEELPAVSPAFSLVDSIMPQLDAIDRAREEQGSTLQEMQPVAADPGPGPRQRTQPIPWWNRMSGRAAMGVAAAAVVLGIVVFNFEPKTVQDAEGMLDSQSPGVMSQQEQTEIPSTVNGSGGRDAAIGSDSTKQPSEQDQGTDVSQPPLGEQPDPSKQDVNSADDEKNPSKQDAAKRDDQQGVEKDSTKHAPAGQPSRQDRKSTKEDPAEQNSAADAPKSDDKQLKQGKSEQQTIAPEQHVEPKIEKAPIAGTGIAQDNNVDSTAANESSSSVNQDMKLQERIASDETSKDTTSKSVTKDSGNTTGDMSSDTASNDQQSSVLQNSVRNEGFSSNSMISPDNNNASTFSAQLTSTDQFNSPDGSYAVVIEGKKLKVYKLSDNGVDRTTLEVRTLKGAWVKGSWSEDSQTFMYETEQDGTASKYTYTIPRTSGK
ncbi:zf-HC2 domain-containing protein [Paenibacillus terrae]|uniref:Anti-sigma-W factor RsiW n=1 Tax=Paenibacillus terrae (strain HPL-003) TaxID=985665 RepID=G7VQE1_PAETH|nr:anti-sigma factor [Paenibacillus terrae]AET61851.1 transmembrane anti-sigma factor [Paenibacillus terrae HPL-003]